MMIAVCRVMVMFMGMGDCVPMHRPVVDMRKSMLMKVGMMVNQRVHDHENRPRDHDQQGNEVDPCQLLFQKHKGEKHAHEWRDRIVCAGL